MASDAGMQESYASDGVHFLSVLRSLAPHRKLLVIAPLSASLIALAFSFALAPTFRSKTLFLPPQQQQSTAAVALAQLGGLPGWAGAAAGLKSSGDQYVALLQSVTVADRLVERFDLMNVYDVEHRVEARRQLSDNTRISLGKRDGLISVEVVDRSPQRAADIANRYVEELRELIGSLALGEAKQRRMLFESQLQKARDQLTAAQQALQASGFSQGALRADARASAEGYARLKAETTAAEVRLRALRRNLAEGAPEVQQALSVLSALRTELSKLEEDSSLHGGAEYVSKFREYKYHETLFELLARQYELARVDEAREGGLVQVVDEAKPAERPHGPMRAVITAVTGVVSLVALAAALLLRQWWHNAASSAGMDTQVAESRSER